MITKYIMKIEDLESELKKPEFESLINDGWKIVMSLPVIDNNNPILIIFLKKESNPNIQNDILAQLILSNKRDKYLSAIIIFLFLIQFIFIIYQSTNIGV
jgi:hypothetical protein